MIGLKITLAIWLITIIWKILTRNFFIKRESPRVLKKVIDRTEKPWYLWTLAVLRIASIIGFIYSIIYIWRA